MPFPDGTLGQFLPYFIESDQFDLYNIPLCYESNTEIPREYCGKNADTMKRFNTMVKRLSERLNGN